MEKTIKSFLSVANFHLIEQQLNKLLNAYTTTKDKNVLQAVKGLVENEIFNTIDPSEEQTKLIEPLYTITERQQGDSFLQSLKPYVIPFYQISTAELKKLFRKEKKLKLPNLEDLDFQHICYLNWDDTQTHRKYIVIEDEGNLKALKGTMSTKVTKGVCSLCNHHGEVSLFTTKTKGQTAETFTKYSNYICINGEQCNHNISDHAKLLEFFTRISE